MECPIISPDPVSHFWFCRRCGVTSGEEMTKLPQSRNYNTGNINIRILTFDIRILSVDHWPLRRKDMRWLLSWLFFTYLFILRIQIILDQLFHLLPIRSQRWTHKILSLHLNMKIILYPVLDSNWSFHSKLFDGWLKMDKHNRRLIQHVHKSTSHLGWMYLCWMEFIDSMNMY